MPSTDVSTAQRLKDAYEADPDGAQAAEIKLKAEAVTAMVEEAGDWRHQNYACFDGSTLVVACSPEGEIHLTVVELEPPPVDPSEYEGPEPPEEAKQ